MSRIEVTHGTAAAAAEPVAEVVQHGGRSTFPHYRPTDVLDAACAVLLAINTPEAHRLAGEVYRLTSANLGPAEPHAQGD